MPQNAGDPCQLNDGTNGCHDSPAPPSGSSVGVSNKGGPDVAVAVAAPDTSASKNIKPPLPTDSKQAPSSSSKPSQKSKKSTEPAAAPTVDPIQFTSGQAPIPTTFSSLPPPPDPSTITVATVVKTVVVGETKKVTVGPVAALAVTEQIDTSTSVPNSLSTSSGGDIAPLTTGGSTKPSGNTAQNVPGGAFLADLQADQNNAADPNIAPSSSLSSDESGECDEGKKDTRDEGSRSKHLKRRWRGQH